MEETSEKNTAKEAAVVTNKIIGTTEYVQIEYDINSEEEEYYQLEIPKEWIGYDRETLEKEISDYILNPTQEDSSRCLISM